MANRESFTKLTQAEWQELNRLGWKFKPAGLYEPDHAARGTQFVIVQGLGLYRVVESPVDYI